ncbi:MAG: hypothetical protein ABL996_24215, partial [Micropepsaceae bacterium]
GQTWLCGREYVNHAWGYQRFGTVLDTAGNIWKYKIERAPAGEAKPWNPNDMSMLTEEDLKMRYEGAMTTGAKVPAEEIARNAALIEEASQATPTTPKGVGADMGQHLLYCYTYDAAKRTYGQVMLDNRGDWDSTNPSPAAKTLATWLDSHLPSTRAQ